MLAVVRAAMVAMAFGACSCASVYHAREGASADGYSERQLEATRWRVEYVGDEIASRDRVESFLLLRAAEVTRANGYDWFVSSAHESEAQEELVVAGTPSERSAVWRPQWRERRSPFFWTDWRVRGPSEHAEQSARAYTAQRYAARQDILLGRGEAPPGAFDAQRLIARLRPERH